MGITSIVICLSSILVLALGKSIPPSLCFEPFIGLDCGSSPLHVLYYYKSGSRCEGAIWRGCPTRNKFQDEYECINTCIFTERVRSEEHHNFGNEDKLEYEEEKINIDKPAATTIAADSGYETDDEGRANDAGVKDRIDSDAEEKADDENAATDNADGENDNDGKNVAEADNDNDGKNLAKADNDNDGKNVPEADGENAADEAKKEAGDANKEAGDANKEAGDANKQEGEANKEAGEGDAETKIEATSEGTMEIGSEDIGAN